MKRILLCVILTMLSTFIVAQNCEKKLKSAKEFFYNKQYELAQKQFELVVKDCGEDYGGAKKYLEDCRAILDKKNAKLDVGKTNVSFGHQGGTESVSIIANTSWTHGKGPDWVKITSSNDKLTIKCEKNSSLNERNGDIYITANDGTLKKKIHIYQSKGETEIYVNKNVFDFKSNGGTDYITVNCNDSWNVSTSYEKWFKISVNGNRVSITCEPNQIAKNRSGSFLIVSSNNVSERITINQNAATTELNVPARLHYDDDGGRQNVVVKTNATNWSATSSSYWCSVTKTNDKEMRIVIQKNSTSYPRNCSIRIHANSTYKDIYIEQEKRGDYKGVIEDYFDNLDGEKKVTYLEASAYILGSYGIRLSTFKYRWKFVEADALNLNFGIYDVISVDWEPMVRGYLPLSGNGCCWAAFLGLGARINFFEDPWKDNDEYTTYNSSSTTRENIVFETGVEYNWENRENTSTRLFIRYDGNVSIGIAFGLGKWNY